MHTDDDDEEGSMEAVEEGSAAGEDHSDVGSVTGEAPGSP